MNNKEELEKEAEEWLCNNLHSASEEDFIKAMVDIAEPREKRISELEAQIEKMKCCGNCIHCKYDENEESYEFCEKHNQVVNIAIQPCSEYETYNFDKAIKEIK